MRAPHRPTAASSFPSPSPVGQAKPLLKFIRKFNLPLDRPLCLSLYIINAQRSVRNPAYRCVPHRPTMSESRIKRITQITRITPHRPTAIALSPRSPLFASLIVGYACAYKEGRYKGNGERFCEGNGVIYSPKTIKTARDTNFQTAMRSPFPYRKGAGGIGLARGLRERRG